MQNMSSGSSESFSKMMSMSMVFTTDHSTPLYSQAWTPATSGAYGATCIFLIGLAIISRLLFAYRQILETRWRQRCANRRYFVVAAESARQQEKLVNSVPGEDVKLARSKDEFAAALPPRPNSRGRQPWRLSTDLPRACIFTVQAGVGYLLMLAVMTLNVGYFLSVLTGLFVGELLVGRYGAFEDAHH